MKRTKLSLACAMASGLCIPALAGAAEVTMGVTLGATNTDNVFLLPAPNTIDESVWQVSPFLNVAHESPTIDASLRYRGDWFRYDDLKTTDVFHMGAASVTAKLLENSLNFEAGLNRRNVIRDPSGVIPPGLLSQSGNLVERDELYLNPRFNRRLGGSISLAANYRVAEASYGESLIQDDTSHAAQLQLQNYEAGEGLTWALKYNWRRTEYEISAPWENQMAAAELGVWLNGSARIFAAGGKESAWDDPLNPEMTDEFYEGGIAVTRGEQFSLELAAGERSFGSSVRADLQYAFRRGSTKLHYSENPTTTGFNAGQALSAVLDPDDFSEFLDVPGSAERYLAERLQWDLKLDFRRTDVNLVVFDEQRSGRVTADGTPRPDENQKGARLSLSWQAGPRTQLVASGSIIDRDSGGNATDSRFNQAGLTINYRLGSRTRLSLGYLYNEQQPEVPSQISRDYVANVVSLLLTYTN